MKLYLIRHGESECNVKRRLYGHTDCMLTEKGCRQAREAGEKLRGTGIGRCISSPLIRAAETARLAFMDGSVRIELDDRLMEQDMGIFEDKPFEEMLEQYPELVTAMLTDWTGVVPPEGESFEQLRSRVQALLDELAARDEDTVLVSHNGPLSTIMMLLLEMPSSAVNRLWFEQGCWSCIELKDGVARLLYFNK